MHDQSTQPTAEQLLAGVDAGAAAAQMQPVVASRRLSEAMSGN
jgi:hypothetical protein